MSTVIYFNAFYKKPKGVGVYKNSDIFIETIGVSREEAIDDINDTPFPYAFTLEVDLEGETNRIDLESESHSIKYTAAQYRAEGEYQNWKYSRGE